MSDVLGADPSRFGQHSSGLRKFLDEVLELLDEQLGTVAARHREIGKENVHNLHECLNRASLTDRSAVDKASRATYHQIKGAFGQWEDVWSFGRSVRKMRNEA